MITAKNTIDLVNQGVEWEIAFFDFVDHFRKSKCKGELIEEKPSFVEVNKRYNALLCSMVLFLCEETDSVNVPEWASEDMWLEKPWFVCGLSRMYSFSLVETPIWFKINNIFVLSNFMDRV